MEYNHDENDDNCLNDDSFSKTLEKISSASSSAKFLFLKAVAFVQNFVEISPL